jgi:predicted glycosyltransferase
MVEQPARVMIYCQDSLGLGHLRRNVHIAQALSRLEPDSSFLLVADSPVAPFFELPRNSDFLKLPTVVKVKRGDWEVHGLQLLGSDRVFDLRARLLRDAALDFRPHVLLVDHMPHGARGELIPCLEALSGGTNPCRRVVGLRDILGAPDDIVPKWREFGAYALLREYYDALLVYGTRSVYDAGSAYGFPRDIEDKLRYCGYVAPVQSAPAAESERLPEGFDEMRQNVVVMGGGGSDAHDFMDTVLEAIRRLGGDVSFNTYLVTGPFMPPAERQQLEDKARGLPVAVHRVRDDGSALLAAADVVVSMAGYNTTCEILRCGSPAIVVPRAGPSAEQTLRTRILHDRGLLHAIEPAELSPSRMANAILEALARDGAMPAARPLDLDGAHRAAVVLLELAQEVAARQPLPEASASPPAGLGALALGRPVKVKGAIDAGGFTAFDVRCKGVSDIATLEGPIQRIEPERRLLRVLDRELSIPEDTPIKNLMRDRVELEALATGDQVAVHGHYDRIAGFVPDKVKRQEAFGFALERVRGRIEALDLEDQSFEVAGIRVRVTDETAIRAG